VTLGHPNPDSLAQAAHGLREVMNAVGRLAGLPQESEGRLRDYFDPAGEVWRRAQDQSQCFDGSAWGGKIDAPAAKAMKRIDDLVAWDVEHRRARREVFLEATRELDGSGRHLPKVEEDRLWRDWDRVKSFFNAVAKHAKKATEHEFDERLSELNALLHRLVGGDVYREQKQLIELIKEVEGGA
jgi:hypothetical protein